MKNDWLKEGLNDKLGNYDSPMDLEKAWQALEDRRRPEKKKRRFLIWWLSGLALLISISGYLYWQVSNSKTQAERSTVSEIKEEVIKQIPAKGNIKKIKKEKNNTSPGKEALNNKQIFSQPSESLEAEKSTQENLKAKKTNSNYQTKLNDKNNILTKSNQNTDEQNNVVNQASKNLLKVQSKVISNSLKNDLFLGQTNEPSISLIPNEISKQTLPQATLLTTKNVESLIKKETSLVQQLPLLTIPLLKAGEGLFTFKPNLDVKYLEEKKSKNRKIDLPQHLGITGGYGSWSRGKTIFDEVPLDAFSFQLFYQKHLSKNLYVKTGIYYNEFTTKLNAIGVEKYFQPMDNQLIIVNEYNNGLVDQVFGIAEVEVIETTSAQIYNRYKFVSVPLILGVEILKFDNSSFEIEGGVSTTIFTQYDGQYLADDNNFSSIEDFGLKKSGLLSGLYAAQWNFSPFAKQRDWKFFVKYQGSLQLNELNSVGESILEKFGAQQFFVGLKYQL